PAAVAKSESVHDLHLSADGRILVTTMHPVDAAGKASEIRWNVETGEMIVRKELDTDWRMTFMNPTAISPDGNWTVCAGRATRGSTESIEITSPTNSYYVMMNPAQFSSDSRFVVVAQAKIEADGEQGSVVVFDLLLRRRVGEIPAGQSSRFV